MIGATITEVVTPGDVSSAPGAWHPANERAGGVSEITSDQPDSQGGNGSLDQFLPPPTSPSPPTLARLIVGDAMAFCHAWVGVALAIAPTDRIMLSLS